MLRLNEVTVDGVALNYFAAGDPSHPCILVLADSTLARAPAISLSARLARIYHLVVLPIPFTEVVQSASEDTATNRSGSLPRLIAGFAESVGLGRFVVYAADALVPIARRLVRSLGRKIVALIAQHDCSGGLALTIEADRVREVGPAVPTLVVIGDQDVAPPVGADGADLFEPARLVVRRFDTSHFPLDVFHFEIAAEVDRFLRGAGIQGAVVRRHTRTPLGDRTCALV